MLCLYFFTDSTDLQSRFEICSIVIPAYDMARTFFSLSSRSVWGFSVQYSVSGLYFHAAWVVTGLFLLAFAVRLVVVLSCREARTLAVRDGGGDGLVFPAVLLLFAVEFYRTGRADAAMIALIVFVLAFFASLFLMFRGVSEK